MSFLPSRKYIFLNPNLLSNDFIDFARLQNHCQAIVRFIGTYFFLNIPDSKSPVDLCLPTAGRNGGPMALCSSVFGQSTGELHTKCPMFCHLI